MPIFRKWAQVATLLACAASASADPVLVSVNQTAGTLQSLNEVNGFLTTGEHMAGIRVTAFFASGADARTWVSGAAGSGFGGVTGSGWSLTLEGDSINNYWTLSNSSTNSPILSLLIEGMPGGIVFDVVGDQEVSTGSALGAAFYDVQACEVDGDCPPPPLAQGAAGLEVNAIFSDRTLLQGFDYSDTPFDLYSNLTLSFGDTGLVGDFSFVADTDNARFGKPNPGQVPEPASLALLGLSLLCAGGAARRRR
ncbi:PEP-CTERM sorting domain-containing protein [Inhella proteolytica]|uniref:PEP-CTERM sorting domain-containing protein n=1 Tax=Inhella proteolytica TaxID=2795029 RepID=A0A931J396_9BURK|nr:PEP-CTERM sorting domain-containing protein [Inhella proteolytica]MBH9577958.1 PEP-CTERM sorting domain-containing protein [Inhella proteolytica]